jgi:hypothetical protein
MMNDNSSLKKIPLHIAAEEDIPKTDYIFISAARGRDKVK